MTTIQLYRKHKAGEVSKEKFLYEVRRDNNLPWITNLTSYEDAIKILKNKSIISDEKPAIVSIPAIGLMTEAKETKKELTLDTVNPYEYRHGIQYELAELDEYTDEALEKAKAIVLKNLNKDANFYSTLLNAKQSPYTFKSTETDAKGMQAKADGYLKKEAKKDEKANVQDTLGKKEAGKKKPKGIKIMPDKGVTGSEKTIKEGLEEAQIKVGDIVIPNKGEHKGQKHKVIHVFDDGSMNIQPVRQLSTGEYAVLSAKYIKYRQGAAKAKPEDIELAEAKVEEGSKDPYDKAKVMKVKGKFEVYTTQDGEIKTFDTEAEAKKFADDYNTGFRPGVDLGASFEKMKGGMNAEDEFKSLMSKYDWYYEMSDDPRTYDRGLALDKQLKSLGKQIGVDKAVELFNAKAPSDRKETSSFFMEDKHAKIKEALKKALKEEDPALVKLNKDEENTEKALASILQKKAAILNKPGTQG